LKLRYRGTGNGFAIKRTALGGPFLFAFPANRAGRHSLVKDTSIKDAKARMAQARKSREWRKQAPLLSRKDLVAILGCTYPTILDAIRRNAFPRPRKFLGRTVWFSN
jgi:predicted DNA-binding transcriptional regulator AlpA